MPFDCGTSTTEAEDNLGGAAFPINCGCWSCPHCAARNQRRLRRQIRSGRFNRFITLTCREGRLGDPILAAREQRAAWNLVVHRWRRLKPTNKCEYAVVCEEHKNGYPHLHIAWKGEWIDQDWLSKQMAELTDSPIADVRRVYGWRGMSYYLTKYLGKAPHQYGTLKRFWFSQGYPRSKRERNSTVRFKQKQYHRRERAFEAVVADWKRRGRSVQYFQWGGAGWGFWYERPKTRRTRDPPQIHYRSGIPHMRTRQGWGL